MKKSQYLFAILIQLSASNFVLSQNIGINNPTPDASAVLDLTSANKGLLIPRVALTAANSAAPVTSPAISLLVYNTTTTGVSPNNVMPGFYYWDGIKWIASSGGSGGKDWSLNGNSGTVDGTHFIGTSDNVPLSFRVFNQKAARIESGILANTVFGYQSLNVNTTGSKNLANGYQSLYSNTTGSGNTANGYWVLRYNTIATSNTATGFMSMYSNISGNNNTANGYHSLYNNTTGHTNVAIGIGTLQNNDSGSFNVAIGGYAGLGSSGVDFNNCIFLGNGTYPTVPRTNVTMLGYGIVNAQCTANNQVLLGNTSTTSIRAQVTGITAYSDARFKTNILNDVKGLEFILKLKPVTYNERPTELHNIWGTPDSLVSKIDHSEIEKIRYIGFLAQDVEKAAKESGFDFPGIDPPKNEKEVYSLRYTDFTMPLVKAIQEQQQQIEELKKKIEEIKKK